MKDKLPLGQQMVPIERLSPHPDNFYSISNIDDLAESIRITGEVQELLINTKGQIISGNRRFAASQKAGLKELPCKVIETTSREEEVVKLVEMNNQRVKSFTEKFRELEELEKVYSNQQGKRTDLMKEWQDLKAEEQGLQRHEIIAKRMGINPSEVRRLMNVSKFGKELLPLLDKGEMNLTDADKLVNRLKKGPTGDPAKNVDHGIIIGKTEKTKYTKSILKEIKNGNIRFMKFKEEKDLKMITCPFCKESWEHKNAFQFEREQEVAQ